MKKFFQRLDNSSSRSQPGEYSRETLGSASGSGLTGHGGSFIGKVFTLGQYHCTVEDIIAEGGFALVFLVKAQSSLGRFALKRLHVNNEQDLNTCKREIEIAKQLGSHKNIVQLVESSINLTSNGVYEILMLMQYCRGHLLQLLNDRLKDGGLPETEVVKILCDTCEAIARMHYTDPPIIHRDLKVENILISESGTYLLCDFGSATTKILSTSTSGVSALAIEEEIKRYTTLAYRAPEMVDVYSGKPITTKADIWALGCLLYKLLFFSLPFGESTLAIQNAALTIPDDASERYSTKLLSLLAYMLTADPEDRPDIYQVGALAFALADQKSPIPNRTVTKTVKVPDWTELRVPPTESQAREIREARKVSTASGKVGGLEPGSGTADGNLEARTTSVTPRQRPKASININSVLSTSPLPFARATTPSDLTSSAPGGSSSSNTLSVTSGHHSQLTTSASFNSTLRGTTAAADDDDEDDVDWSKKRAKAKQSGGGASPPQTSTSNPTLNTATSYAIATAAPSKTNNPFLDASGRAIPQPLPLPPSRRHSQTPPGIQPSSCSRESVPNVSLHASHQPHHHHHAHRRNMSDTSAFSSKNVAAAAATAAAAAAADARTLAAPQQAATRVRSLNPFEDPNDLSYEDQLFGHEFDKIRLEGHPSVLEQSATTAVSSRKKSSHNPSMDPFEAAPFNPAQLKRYFSRQQSAESTETIVLSPNQSQGVTATPGKPYLMQVNTSSSSAADSGQPKSSSSTVIMIRSNNDFVIRTGTGSKVDSQQPAISTPGSSAFIALGGAGAGAGSSLPHPILPPPPPQIAVDEAPSTVAVTADQSISSSSQGQITFSPAANYMPLYSSDTAEDDSENSSDDEDSSLICSSDGDSVKAKVATAEFGELEDEMELVDGSHVAQEMSGDLMKPLVVDEESEVEEEVEEEEDFGSESSIGSASDLAKTDDSDDDVDSDDSSSDGRQSFAAGEHVGSSDSEGGEQGLEQQQNGHESDHGFEFINYDGSGGGGTVAPKNGTTAGWPYAYSKNATGKNISRIQIIGSSMEVDDTSGAPVLEPAVPDDGTSTGEVLSTTSSVNSSATRNTANNDNTSASIDHLIGHIEGHRPLLEEEDDTEEPEDSILTQKPFIEMDAEPIPPQLPATDSDSIMFNSMSSSISSVILREVPPPKDLLTDDPSPPCGDFETLSLQQQAILVEDSALDDEVAQSLNSQVIHDALTHKDLFGSIPFNDKELINKTMLVQKSSVPIPPRSKPEVAPKPAVSSSIVLPSAPPLPLSEVVHSNASKFESSFTAIPAPPQKPVVLSTDKIPTSFRAPAAPAPQPQPTTTKSTDLFGAIPFQSSEAAAAVPLPPPPSFAAPKLGPLPPPLQIITLKPLNHGQQQQPKTVPSKAIPAALPQPSISLVSSTALPPAKSVSVTQLVKTVSSGPAIVPGPPSPPPVKSVLQKSNSKLKSKVAKKYEVDESDDEVDGLLVDEDGLEDEAVLGGKSKSGKESKKKDKKKEKEKKEKPEKKSKEKDKEKSKESKKKEKIKEPKPEKVKKSKEEKEKEKAEKKKKDKEKEKEGKEAAKKGKVKVTTTDETKDTSGRSVLILNAVITSSTPLKASSAVKESSSTKESSSKSTSKLKLPKHQAFANMSFEDESSSTHGAQSSGLSTTAVSNAVTITRC